MSSGWSRLVAAGRLAPLAVSVVLALAVPAAGLAAARTGAPGRESSTVFLAPVAASPNGPSGYPSTTVNGGCGTVTLTIVAGAWSGTAVIAERATSAWGPILSASWSVRWQNSTTGASGSYSGSQLVLSDVMTHSDTVSTGRGLVTATLTSLEVLLWWGARCRSSGILEQAWIP